MRYPPPPNNHFGTHFPGLSSSPPAGHWQHSRMYSCRADWSNIQCDMLSAVSPAQGKGGGKEGLLNTPRPARGSLFLPKAPAALCRAMPRFVSLLKLIHSPSPSANRRSLEADEPDFPPLTLRVKGTVQQGQQPRLPEGVAAIHQLVAAALETALEVHLPPGHPVLHGTAGFNTRSGFHHQDRGPPQHRGAP